MFTRHPLITWGRFAIPEKRPSREEETAVRGKRAGREPLPGADSRAHARRGACRGRGGNSIRRGDLLSMSFPRSVFSPAICFPSSPGKERVSPGIRGPAQHIDRQCREKLHRFEEFPAHPGHRPGGLSQRSVRQERVTVMCRRFQGTRGDIPGGSGGHSFPSSQARTRNDPPGRCVPRPALTVRGEIGENDSSHAGGGVAQLGEHHVRNVGVEGSIPFSSTTFFSITTNMHQGIEPASGADGQEEKRDAREPRYD
jgi:hypothetical protein